jgi:NADH:ubiquinone oxidoreductase subunit 6 (subunit J)
MSALTILGLGLWVVDLLVVFFAPAAIRLGHGSSFVGVILVLALVGLVLVLLGRRERTA